MYMMITNKVSMDLMTPGVPAVINGVQEDRYTRSVELTLTISGEAWTIPEDVNILIRYARADGSGGQYDTLPNGEAAWAAKGNVLMVRLAPQVLALSGVVNLWISLIRQEVQISTFALLLNVHSKAGVYETDSQGNVNVNGFLPGVTGGGPGEFLRITQVSDNGYVQSLEPVELGSYALLKEPQLLTEEQKRQVRINIGVEAGEAMEPSGEDIPKVYFGAPLPQTKDEVVMPFRYISKTTDISGWCKTKAQGNSSLAYPKKNQTVKLYADADCTQKLKVNFKGWGKQNKFCFKANWIDITHARNVVSARLWGDVVKSRSNYAEHPEPLRTAPNQGAVDGFPVKVYADGIYQGRYTINIPKDAWMANMDDSLDTHCILCGEGYTSGCFREEAVIDGTDWTDEVHDTVPEEIKTRWNEIIRFVCNSGQAEFVSGIGDCFDVDSLIDYYLFGLLSCGLDAFGKNQLYMTWDGRKWFAAMYDMDATWGLWWDGSQFVSAEYGRREFEDFAEGRPGNLLYVRLESFFIHEIKARWEVLKNGALSRDHILDRFERFVDLCPPWLVEEDYAQTTAEGGFTAIPSVTENNIQQIRKYVHDRFTFVDNYISNLTEPTESDNLWSISDKTEKQMEYYSPADTQLGLIEYGTYTLGVAYSGYWRTPLAPVMTIDGENITLTMTNNGYGLGVPIELEAGATYRIAFTLEGGRTNINYMYYDDNGAHQKGDVLRECTEPGTYSLEFVAEDYAHFVLVLTPQFESLNVPVTYKNIVFEKV